MELPNAARSFRRDGEFDVKGLLRPITDVERIYQSIFGGREMPSWHRSLMITATRRHMALMDPKLRDPGLWVNGKQVLKF